ncbi:DUF6328 family protein [Granulicoccus sp. GXG6511]|uniref:DUF6328 family protein n=1 Tax=Granulicoccus sp. GXG6511 TaxID=3381351 RepID=UPI003D7E0444
MTQPDREQHERDRDEAPGERLDRQFNELLQELRVTQTGIQLLGGFLLILPFQQRFGDLSGPLRMTYLTSVTTATLSILFVVAPVLAHRLMFASHRKDVIVTMGHQSARVGLALLGVTVVTATALIFGVVLNSHLAALIAGIVAGIICIGLWLAWPLTVAKARPGGTRYAPSPHEDSTRYGERQEHD